MKKFKLIKYLDEYLQIDSIDDSSKNGLQVDNSKDEIKKIGYAVDSTNYIFDLAKEQKVDFLITHHGIFWGHEEVVVGIPYKRIKNLISNDIGLYACHLPLDLHKEVGNNIGLLKGFLNIFGIGKLDDSFEFINQKYETKDFSIYQFGEVGYGLFFEKRILISSLQTIFAENLFLQKKLYNFGNIEYLQSIAFCSGGGGFLVEEAFKQGYDLLVTGEAKHSDLTKAKELGQSILLGGHYETEKIGVKLLANHLSKKFALETVFLDCKY